MQTVSSLEEIARIPLDQRKYWYIAESLTSTLSVADVGESMVEVGDAFSALGLPLASAPVTPLKAEKDLYLREGMIPRIAKVVQKLLADTDGQVTLKITDAFRPLRIQRKYFKEISEQVALKEGLTGRALWERVTQFIADPDLCPPHSTGGAVDCTLVRISDGQELDMGTSVDAINDLANTWTDGISEEAKKNRALLYNAMNEAGMVNLATEWWHYSYGDQYWAAYNQLPHALYGSQEDLS